MVEVPNVPPGDLARAAPRRTAPDPYDSTIPAGYTYFGQFIDHDITFDPLSSLARHGDPNAIHNFRTPRLDLDSVYGRGPDDQPYLYDQRHGSPRRMLFGSASQSKLRDLPRNKQGRALIGDARNDENAIVSQLHLAFLLAHNELVDRARKAHEPFEAARRALRWLYQYILWNDFLKRVTVGEVHKQALKFVETADGRGMWELGLRDVYNWKKQPFIPVEFSAAAYRFGHSMVRNEYRTNESRRTRLEFAPLFDRLGLGSQPDLGGFRRIHDRNVIQWDWFLPMTSSDGQLGFPQKARKIDTKLSNSLAYMRADRKSSSPLNVLAYRNLKRGWTLGLPAGTAVARRFGLAPVALGPGEPDALWFYILREAAPLGVVTGGNRLGPLGSMIVCATFAGLLKGDPSSYLNAWPRWTPDEEPLLCRDRDNIDGDPVAGNTNRRTWTLASIIRIAGLPVDMTEFQRQERGIFSDSSLHA